MDNVEQIVCIIRNELADDYVGLWEIVWICQERAGESSAQLIKAMVLQVIEHLLTDANVVVGQYEGRNDGDIHFAVWHMSPSDIAKRILNEWECRGEEPNIGDICWFKLLSRQAIEIEPRQVAVAAQHKWLKRVFLRFKTLFRP